MSKVILDTQIVNYNKEEKRCSTFIEEPFFSAGKKLGWRWRPQAIGLNLKVIKFILDYKFDLIVNIGTYHASYFIKFNKLLDYLKYNECDYKIRNTVLKVIPIEILTPFKLHKETT